MWLTCLFLRSTIPPYYHLGTLKLKAAFAEFTKQLICVCMLLGGSEPRQKLRCLDAWFVASEQIKHIGGRYVLDAFDSYRVNIHKCITVDLAWYHSSWISRQSVVWSERPTVSTLTGPLAIWKSQGDGKIPGVFACKVSTKIEKKNIKSRGQSATSVKAWSSHISQLVPVRII